MEINKISNETIFRIMTAVTMFLLFLLFTYAIITPLIWFATAFIITLLLNPVVGWLTKHVWHQKRGLSIAIVYVILFLLFGGLLALVIPIITIQSVGLMKNLPEAYQKFMESSSPIAQSIKNFLPAMTSDKNLTDVIAGINKYLVTQTLSIFGSIAAGFTIFTTSIYMSLEGPKLLKKFWSILSKEKYQRWHTNAMKMYEIVIKYIIANLATATLAGIGATIMLLLVGAPAAIFLGLLVIFLDLIPMIGVWLIGLLLVGMGAIFGGFWPAIIMAIYSLLYAQFEYSYLEPVIYGKATNISPLTIIIAVIIGGTLAGILGLFLAVPVAACVQLLIVDYLKYNKNIKIEI